MKTIILAGGLGSRLAEETQDKPKPMVLIGDKPILWHIMNIYATQGFRDFIIAGGYKIKVISKYIESLKENWNIEVLDTGLNTQTAGRIKRCIQKENGERFFVTYGDGVANVDLQNLITDHHKFGGLITLTAVRPPARFGSLQIVNNKVTHFGEKVQANQGWINGGYFILEKEILKYISSENEPFETGPLPKLAADGQLYCHFHKKFWMPMDTLREKTELDKLARIKNIPWLKFRKKKFET